MTVYGKAVLISLVAILAILIGIMAFGSDRHFSDRTRVKIMAVLQTACAASLAALAVSAIFYIANMA